MAAQRCGRASPEHLCLQHNMVCLKQHCNKAEGLEYSGPSAFIAHPVFMPTPAGQSAQQPSASELEPPAGSTHPWVSGSAASGPLVRGGAVAGCDRDPGTAATAGKKKEFSISSPSLGTAMSVMVWLALILLGTTERQDCVPGHRKSRQPYAGGKTRTAYDKANYRY